MPYRPGEHRPMPQPH